MYKTKRFGIVSCKTENQILAELERDLKRKRKKRRKSHHRGGGKQMTCYIEKETQYGVDRLEFDSGALISRQFEPDDYTDEFLLDTKLTNFKEHGLREGDNVRLHYEKGNNGFEVDGRIDDLNDTFMVIVSERFKS